MNKIYKLSKFFNTDEWYIEPATDDLLQKDKEYQFSKYFLKRCSSIINFPYRNDSVSSPLVVVGADVVDDVIFISCRDVNDCNPVFKIFSDDFFLEDISNIQVFYE